jgi:hypothetical protein
MAIAELKCIRYIEHKLAKLVIGPCNGLSGEGLIGMLATNN